MLSKKWCQDIVEERKSWIIYSNKRIASLEKMLVEAKEHLEKEKEWLKEAEKDLAEHQS